MRYSFLDQFSDLDSFIHRLDPRTKLVSCLAFILAIVLTPPGRWQVFLGYFSLLLILIIISKVPVFYVLKRSLVILPFVVLVSLFIPFFKEGEVAGSYNLWLWQVSVTYTGLAILGNVVTKAWLCVLGLILLSATTGITDLLKGLEGLGIPRVIVLILSFMYRYIFVVVDEAMWMRQAWHSRSFGNKGLRQIKTLGNIIGSLFVRSYERGERVYVAMLARGFDGKVRTLHSLTFRKADFYCGGLWFILLVVTGVFLW